MTTQEKLNTLFILSNTTNAKLATALHVDPSLVSRWRNGTRNLTGNEALIANLSQYFASLLADPLQVRMMEHLISTEPGLAAQGELAKAIETWLAHDAGDVFHHLGQEAQERAAEPDRRLEKLAAGRRQRHHLTGWRSRVQAVEQFLARWRRTRCIDGELIVYCDENRRLTDIFTAHIAPYLRQHGELTAQLQQVSLIVPDDLGPEEFLGAVNFLLPFVDTALVQVYGMEQMQHDVFHHFLAVMRGVGALTATSMQNSEPETVFHTDKVFVGQLYQNLSALKTNTPTLMKRRDRVGFSAALDYRQKLLASPCEVVYMGNAYLYALLPEDLLYELICIFVGGYGNTDEARVRAARFCAQLEKTLTQRSFLCCVPLFTPEEIESGALDVQCVPKFIGQNPVVNSARYLAILQNIRQLMLNYPNFIFQAIEEIPHNYSACVLTDQNVTLSTNFPQPTYYTSTRPMLMRAQQHNILTRYMAIPEKKRDRQYNIRRLEEQIRLFS